MERPRRTTDFISNTERSLLEDRLDRGVIDSYISQMRRFPRFTSDHLKILFKYMESGSSVADLRSDTRLTDGWGEQELEKLNTLFNESNTVKDVISNSNLPLVVFVAKKYIGRRPFLDIIQDGNEGLMQAIMKYESRRDAFSSFAVPYIKGFIQNGIAGQGMMRVPQETPRTDIPRIVSGDKEWDQALECVEATEVEDPYSQILEELIDAVVEEAELTQKQREVLDRMYGRDMSFGDVAEEFGVSRPAVNQARDAGIRKIRRLLEPSVVDGD